MKESTDRNAYLAAYNQASNELNHIASEEERLRRRRERIENLVEVLNRRFGFEASLSKEKFMKTTELPGLSIRTRLVVVETRSKV